MNNSITPYKVWLSAGWTTTMTSDAVYEVTDAFTAAVRTFLGSGGTVALWDDPVLAPLALYIAREMHQLDHVEVWIPPTTSTPSAMHVRFPIYSGFHKSTSITDAIYTAAPDASLYFGHDSNVKTSYTTCQQLPSHDGLVVGSTELNTQSLASFSTAAPLPAELSELFRTSGTYLFMMAQAYNRILDRLNPLPTPRLNLKGLRRVFGHSLS